MNTAELAQPPSRGTAAPAKGDELTEEEKIRSKENKLARRYEAAGAFFLSFPKSGRTWVRTVVAHYLSQRYGVPFDIEFEADDPRWLRPCFTHNYFDVYRYTPGEPVLLEEERLLAAPLVMLVRDPRDVCASYYHHIKLRDGKWSGHAYEFARDEVYGIERQARFVELLLQFYRRHAGPKVLVRYEDLRKHPLRGFRQLLAMVDRGGVDDAALRTAIELSSFDRMQEEEKKTLLTGVSAAGQARLGITDWNEDDNALKVRKGKVGGYLSEFGLRHAIALSLLPATRRLVLKMKLLPWSAT